MICIIIYFNMHWHVNFIEEMVGWGFTPKSRFFHSYLSVRTGILLVKIPQGNYWPSVNELVSCLTLGFISTAIRTYTLESLWPMNAHNRQNDHLRSYQQQLINSVTKPKVLFDSCFSLEFFSILYDLHTICVSIYRQNCKG